MATFNNEELKDFLSKYWPDTLEIVRGGLSNETQLQNVKLFTDDKGRSDLTTVILAYSEGKLKMIWFYSVDYARALPMLKFVIDLYNYDVIVFGSETLMKRVHEDERSKLHLLPTVSRYICLHEVATKPISFSSADGYKIGSIKSSDIDLAASKWGPATHSKKMEQLMRDLIVSYPNAAIYDTTIKPAKLVSWVASAGIGALYNLYTDEGHRGRGLGTTVVQELTQTLLSKGLTPITYIYSDNVESQVVFTKCGYVKDGSVISRLIPIIAP